MSLELATLAKKCIAANGMQDRITVICKHSSDLQLGKDIPARVDVIVSELVDSGLLGEHIIEVSLLFSEIIFVAHYTISLHTTCHCRH